MQLTKLYEVQKGLKERIGCVDPNKDEKMLLAFYTELGECANEWQGFKYWKKNNEAKTVKRVATEWDDNGNPTEWDIYDDVNPLLEEYVDGLHYVLEMGIDYRLFVMEITDFMTMDNITNQFNYLFTQAHWVSVFKSDNILEYHNLVSAYLGLGQMLGFTSDEITMAYLEKNKVNHERQDNGY